MISSPWICGFLRNCRWPSSLVDGHWWYSGASLRGMLKWSECWWINADALGYEHTIRFSCSYVICLWVWKPETTLLRPRLWKCFGVRAKKASVIIIFFFWVIGAFGRNIAQVGAFGVPKKKKKSTLELKKKKEHKWPTLIKGGKLP